MEKIRILLCCGAGYPSGLLAQKTKRAARDRGIQASVDARSEAQVESFLGKIDVLLLGPHYAKSLEKFQELARPYGVPTAVIPHQIYGLIDGNALLDMAVRLAAGKQEGEKQDG